MRAGRKGLSQSDTTRLHVSESVIAATHVTAGLPVRVMTALPAASYSSAVSAIHRALGRLTSQFRATPRGLLGGTWKASSVDTREAAMSTRSSGATPVLTLTHQRSAETRSWTDARLIAAIQEEPPDQDALHGW